ncbi:MAG: COX15/CtaA family protein [Chloroflexales bacterium]|nr:COX15/CtaA family protein [Chloroflexales bacterium]
MAIKRFERYVWIVLSYTIIVILWGAFVRATGSGAGCGNHWPLCNGEVIPRAPMLETIIEISHRLTSGLLLLLIVGLTFFSFRLFPTGHIVRRGGVLTLAFVIIEALFGAALVLLELVAHNASLTRAFSMSLHLINTLVLVGVITLTGMWVRGIAAPDFKRRGRLLTWVIIGVVMTMLLGASGGIAALGDTLFPTTTFADGLAQDFDMTANVLLRLRVLHPVIAIGTGIVMVIVSQLIAQMRPIAGTRAASRVLLVAYVGQLMLGSLNLVFLAPIPIQLLHLFFADVIWVAFVVLIGLALQREA